jgi:serine/tyrosine/threonine adenylyltransferase
VTIDYGPYGWLEGYDPMWTPNTTDAQTQRYCYGNQPGIAQWNLARLAEALLPIVEREPLEEGLNLYADTFNQGWRRALAAKLGLAAEQPGDDELARELLTALTETETDFTLFFRRLAQMPLEGTDEELLAPLAPAFYDAAAAHPQLAAWLRRYAARARAEGPGRVQRMNSVNPKYVFRNYLAQQAIDALEGGDASLAERLMRVIERPYDEQPENEEFAARRPEWARRKAGCSALSCSS